MMIPESKLLARLAGVGDGCFALASPGVPVVVVVVLAVAVVDEPAAPPSDGLGEVNDSGLAVDCCAETVISCDDQVKVKVITSRPIVRQRMMMYS